jgi:uncharacterized protein YeeX (DUF496 family)
MRDWKKEFRDKFGMPEFKNKEFIKHATRSEEVEALIQQLLDEREREAYEWVIRGIGLGKNMIQEIDKRVEKMELSNLSKQEK